jgi:large subunit ribosomal protein L29
MKIQELRQKNERELQVFLQETRVKLHELSFKAAAKQLKDVSSVAEAKRDIARVLTVLRERRTSRV